MLVTNARNATLPDLAALLRDQHARKLDVVLPATALSCYDGRLIIREDAPVAMDAEGVTLTAGTYRPTEGFLGDLAQRLDIPVRYLRRMHTERPDLFDANVNGWIHGSDSPLAPLASPDMRTFLFRAFRADAGDGIARALLSDRYAIVDNLDVLVAVLTGVKDTGVAVNVDACDLTDNRMYLRISSPAVAALAPQLLAGYRSPYSGNTGEENPTVFAGFVVTNSETGNGAFTITPRLVVQICTNGMTMTKDALRSVHLGTKLEEGVVRWSEDTQRKSLDLVTARARDAVSTFLDPAYVNDAIDTLTRLAGHPVTDAAGTIAVIGKELLFSEEETSAVLDHFIRGAALNSGAVMQAIGAYAQQVPDADRAFELEALAVRAMQLAADLA